MAMQSGVVVAYDADRGFGFIRPRGGAAGDVFVHASAILGREALRVGQRVRFLAETTEKGPRATRVEPGRRGLSPTMSGALVLAGSLAALMALLIREAIPPLSAWLIAANAVAFAVYALDKRRATTQRRRIPEAVLLGLALLGGTLGAIAAMLSLRHKTRKVAFLVPFFGVVAVQGAAAIWWMGRGSS